MGVGRGTYFPDSLAVVRHSTSGSRRHRDLEPDPLLSPTFKLAIEDQGQVALADSAISYHYLPDCV